MKKILNYIIERIKGKNGFLIVVSLFVVCIVVIGVCVSVLPITNSNYVENNSSSSQESDESSQDSSTVFVDDIRSGIIEVEEYEYAVSYIERTDFYFDDDGRISYDGEYYSGIDVSEHQGVIDWEKVAADGVDFAMIRVGYRGATEGGLFVDSNFQTNLEEALANGIEVGVYFFSQAISEEEAIEEAEFIIEQIGDYLDQVNYPIVFDWEHVSITDNRTDAMSGDEVAEFAVAFCETVNDYGKEAMVYLNKSLGYTFYNLTTINEYPLWIAEYEVAPSFYYEYEIWQYSDSGTVDGITGSVDMNISFNDFS